MSLYIKTKIKNNKEIIAAIISSITALSVAVILGNYNLKSTEKQIKNQIILLEKQVDSQKDTLKEQIQSQKDTLIYQVENQQKESDEREKRELEHMDKLHKSSIELQKQQLSRDLELFKQQKLEEQKSKTLTAANYITSDLMVKIIALKEIASINQNVNLQNDSYLSGLPIVAHIHQNFKYSSSEENVPPSDFIENLPTHEMTESLKFYHKYLFLLKNIKESNDITNNLDKAITSESSEYLLIKSLLKKSDEEMMFWLRDVKMAVLKLHQSASSQQAVELIKSGMFVINTLNKITKNKVKYSFDINSLEKETNIAYKKDLKELINFINPLDISYRKLYHALKNANVSLHVSVETFA